MLCWMLGLISVTIIEAQTNSVLIQDVQVIDVINNRISQEDVLLQSGKISQINTGIVAPQFAQIINGQGKYLMPGLVDAHIHLFQSGGIYTRPDALDFRNIRPYEEERQWLLDNAGNILKRYLRCGITTVVDIGGPLYGYAIRDKANSLPGYPNVYLTGPLISTYQPEALQVPDPPIVKVNSTEEARQLVRAQLKYKPDFIKVWYITLPTQTAESTYDIVKATVEEASSHGLFTMVHATELNTAKLAIKAGGKVLVHSVRDPIDEDFINMVRDSSVVYIPTLMVGQQYMETFSRRPELTREDFKYSPPVPLASLFDSEHMEEGNIFDQINPYLPRMWKDQMEEDSLTSKNLIDLSQEGITIATGTDAGNVGTLHASSYFEELDLMRASGLSNFEILRSSTLNGAIAVGKEDELGSIDVGKNADLLLLNSNPLEDYKAVQDINLIFKDGHMMLPDTILRLSPEDLVQQQLNAYNAGNIEAFLEPFADSIATYNYPDILRYTGIDTLRMEYEPFFESTPDLHCELLERMVQGNTVIDHERVTGIPDLEAIEVFAIYKIDNEKITEVRFLIPD